MEKNINEYIRRLIELDTRAVALKSERDTELMELEVHSKNELKDLQTTLEETAVKAKQKHDEVIEAAKAQAKVMDEVTKLKIDELQAYFANLKEDAAKDIWKRLLTIER